jgi:RHS repeat-associated protein
MGLKVKQFMCLFLIFCLLAISTPAAPGIIVEDIASLRQDVALLLMSDNWFPSLSGTSPGDQETQEERNARVTRIEIDSINSTVVTGRQVPLIAIAYDRNDDPVTGVDFEWQIEDEKGDQQEILDNTFIAANPGEYKVIVRGAGIDAGGAFIVKSPLEGLRRESGVKTESQMPIPYDEWGIENFSYARNIKNIRGNSPGKPKGRSNFNISAPVFSLPGRGVGVDLNLFYNSQVWSKLDQDISYDMDKDWMAPGWTMGFGKIVNIIGGGIVQVDADGTRHYYSGTPTNNPDSIVFEGQSTDGSFVKSQADTSGILINGQPCFYNPITHLKYPDGTTVRYDAFKHDACHSATQPITMVPNRIQDRNGNQINIAYWYADGGDPPGRWIKTITDSLHRTYTFNYTLINNRYYLTSITGLGLPDQGGTPVLRTFVRLQYQDHTITHNFSGLTPHVPSATVKVLSAIYYPATAGGYWFGDTSTQSPSYSPYGMIRKVEEHKGMTYSEQNGIGAGQMTRQRTYSYPVNTNTAISDIPSYETMTETWEGITTAAPVTTFQVNWDATPRTTTIIAANQSKVIEYSHNYSSLPDTDPDKNKDGLTYKTEYYDSNNQIRGMDEVEWELGYQVSTNANSKIPRPKKMTGTEYENGITLTKTTFNDTFGEYNQVLESRQTGYGGVNDVLRRYVTAYTKKGDSLVSGDDWRARPRLINLPTQVEVFDGNNTRIGLIKYDYDQNALQALSGSNPTEFCSDSFCNSITDRGNISKTTSYSDAVNLTGEYADNAVYDKTGNLVEYKPQITLNTVTKYKYTLDTKYAFPEETTTGADDPNSPNLNIKTTATYNIETGYQLTSTDQDQQTVQINRDANTWRVMNILLPTGGSTVFTYDDLNRAYSESAFKTGSVLAGKRIQKINGRGQVYRDESYAKTDSGQDVFEVVEAEYDEFGRMTKASNPFKSNESAHGVYWSEMLYDSIGRLWKKISADGSTSYIYFNEASRPQGASSEPGQTIRTKDPIGREKWSRNNSDDVLAEVIEPDPNGSGAVATNGLLTKYTYDRAGQLTQTEQGSQLRKFKYDSLGRLTHQKMAETKATLDNSGAFVGDGNGTWSDFYTYDKFSHVSSHKDARGVTTTFSYQDPAAPQFPVDPLNRIFSVSYNANGAADVLSSPTVNYAYPTTGNFLQLKSITTTGVSTVDFTYDTAGRLMDKKTTLTSRPNYPMLTSYAYDSLNRVSDIIYPKPYGSGNRRKAVHTDFDASGKLSALQFDGINYASEFAYNQFGQMTSIKIGPSGANQITETYNYSAQTGSLQNQKVLKSGTALLDLSYEYQQCGCSSGAGQITKITNNLDRNKDRAYQYDALRRLKKVTGGVNSTWSQTYSYDRYGNRTGVTSTGVEALKTAGGQSPEAGSKGKSPDTLMPGGNILTGKSLLEEVQKLSKIDGEKERSDSTADMSGLTEDPQVVLEEVTPESEEDSLLNDASRSSLPPIRTPFDFDYDGKADVSMFQRTTGLWTVLQSGNGQTTYTNFGTNGDQIAPGDYDGDGKTDQAVWRPSEGFWYILASTAGYYGQQWGTKGDAIVPADYDGDGKTDVAVWRPSTGIWYITKSSDGSWYSIGFGGQQFGDIPVPGDYDGDGKADIAVWRPTSGEWWMIKSSNGQYAAPVFGTAGDVPMQADYDGDGKADLAKWTPSTGIWSITKSSNGQVSSTQWGGLQFGDIPVAADYDGDGKADLAVWRATTGEWFILRSSDGGFMGLQFGSNGNIPVPSAYRRRSSGPKNQNQNIPRDGLETVAIEAASNRITTSGFTYDLAGNQTRILKADGTALRFQYDAAGRMVKVKNDSSQTLVTYTYGHSRERLVTQEGNESSTNLTYYAWEAGAVISEFAEGAGNILTWAKNYIYLGGSLLATQEKTLTGEKLQFDHADQLGTRIITDPGAGTHFEQTTLPFGTALDSESSGSINRRFTNYDRSASTGLDYATNRFYDSAQGRFTQVDPIGVNSSSLTDPQSLNLFAYTENDPVNNSDPDGLDGFDDAADLRWVYWQIWTANNNGMSLPPGWSQFFQGLFGALFSRNFSYAGRIIASLLGVPAFTTTPTELYGIAGALLSMDPNIMSGLINSMKSKIMTPCEEKIAKRLTKSDSAIVADAHDGSPFDSAKGSDYTHDHIYNDPFGDINTPTNFYVPKGGQILEHFNWISPLTDPDNPKKLLPNTGIRVKTPTADSQSVTTIYFAQLGKLKDVVMQVWHIVDFKKTPQTDGTILIGNMGADGKFQYAARYKKPSGVHFHINLFKKWWSGVGTKGYSPGVQQFGSTRINLSELCKQGGF